MRRCLALFVGSLLMVLHAPAAQASWTGLQKWVDKYPVDEVDGQTFAADPDLVAEATKVLGDKSSIFFNMLSGGVAYPIQQQGDVLYSFACKAHVCESDSASLFVDLRARKLSICWHEKEGAGDIWFSSEKTPRQLVSGACVKGDGFAIYDENVVKE